MTAIQLTPAQRKEKRADAHHVDPVVMIGNDGLTEAVTREVDAALAVHGLVKVRVASEDRMAREAALMQLAESLGAAPIQHIGKLLVLWRPPVAKEKVVREDRMPGPKVVKILKFSKSGNHRAQVKKIRVVGNMRIAAGGELKRARKRTTSIKKSAQQS
ncbi:MAG: YhbY family RNA-binding protein [Burkholderiaceae bacterium]